MELTGIQDLVFHDMRRTFATWLTQCGVDYAVIRMLRGEPLPGSAKYYIHNWDVPLRESRDAIRAVYEAGFRRDFIGSGATYCHFSATILHRTNRNPAKNGEPPGTRTQGPRLKSTTEG